MVAEQDKTPVAIAAECRAIIMVNRSEGRGSEDLGETQAVEGYGCVCSFKSDIKKEFTNHLILAGRLDDKGV